MQLVSRFSGQVTDSPLIVNDQFSLGGAQSVRGYYETQDLVDDGVSGSLELYSPNFMLDEWDFVKQLKLLAFVDLGKGWRKEALPKEPKDSFLSSAGVGLRFQLWKHLTGVFDVGVPFTSRTTVQSGDPRLHFSIASEF